MSDSERVARELAGIAGVRVVHEMRSTPSPDWPQVVVELDAFDAYNLAVITCALIRAMPDVDRRHVGVIWGPRMHGIVAPLATPIAIPTSPTPTRVRVAHVEMDVSVDEEFLVLRRTALAPYPDPFRSPAPPRPQILVLASEPLFREIVRLVPEKTYRVDWFDTIPDALEGRLHRVYIDESLAPEALSWLAKHRADDLARTFVVSDEHGRDWLEEFVRSLGARGVEIVTLGEIPASLRNH